MVGIYLVFILIQNPKVAYSIESAKEYNQNRNEFNRKVKDHVIKNAEPSENDLKLIYIMNNYEILLSINNRLKKSEDNNNLNFLQNEFNYTITKNENDRLKKNENILKNEIQ